MPEIDEGLPTSTPDGGVRSILTPETRKVISDDPVSRVLKWVLLGTAILCFALIAWATQQTYRDAPMQPDRFVAQDGTLLMSGHDIIAGKSGFQQADLMDYGSLYGMGSYFGPDYTAENLVALATATQDNLAQASTGQAFASLRADQQAAIKSHMQAQLHGVDLTQRAVTIPDALAGAITTVRDGIAIKLRQDNFAAGYSKARSLDAQAARQTADFLIYSSLTTVAHRPGTEVSWTQNWPYEPIAGNAPTSATFIWTWASFCFVFFGFGAVLFIYQIFLSDPDVAPMDPVLTGFRALTPSQRKTGKYFLFVAAVLLLQIGAGSTMAHYYSDRTSFYGVPVDTYVPFNFLRSVHLQAPLIWIAFSWIGSGLFLAPVISGREAKHQGLLVDILFWASLIVVTGALIGQLPRHHGPDRRQLVLVRQPRAVISGDWPLLADCLFPRIGHVELAGMPRVLAEPSSLVGCGPAFLDRAHPVGTPALGRDDQHRCVVRLRDDSADRGGGLLHHHRLLAVVGRASVGGAIVRILRRCHERLLAYGGSAWCPAIWRSGLCISRSSLSS